jgi:hypothetical protein
MRFHSGLSSAFHRLFQLYPLDARGESIHGKVYNCDRLSLGGAAILGKFLDPFLSVIVLETHGDDDEVIPIRECPGPFSTWLDGHFLT